jgi:hypothetical protein
MLRQAVRPRRGPTLREASFEDYPQIALLEARHGFREKSYEEWSHVWLANPLFRELQGRWPIGWVLEDGDHHIVASLGSIPRLYELEGRRLVAAASRFWVADAGYRSAALLLLDRLINRSGADLFLSNTVSAASAAAVDSFDCRRVPVGVWNESAFWITNYRGFVESLLTLRRYPLARLLSYPLSAVFFLKDQLTRPPVDTSDVEVKACPAFDDRFDQFWIEARRSNPHLLWAVRTREVLEWHYKYALLNNRLWIATVVDGPRLVAYAIFDRKDKRTIGLKRVRFVDFQSLDGSTALLPPLLSWAIERCHQEGVHVLESAGRWLEKGEPLDRISCYRRRLPNWTFVYRANDPQLGASLSDPHVWAPSLFDSDSSLVQ